MITDGAQELLAGALILIVDDEPANLQLLADLLKQRGHKVRVAPDGQLALNYIDRQKPDLILLDVNMPDMDGFEVCRRLKDNPDWAMIPVIFISASDEEQNIVRSFAAGGVDYVTKPFHSAEVEARVETHLKLYGYQRRLEVLVQEKVREAANAIERASTLQRIGMMGVISAGIAHEINQPLNALKMRADSLLYWENQRNLPQWQKSCKMCGPFHNAPVKSVRSSNRCGLWPGIRNRTGRRCARLWQRPGIFCSWWNVVWSGSILWRNWKF